MIAIMALNINGEHIDDEIIEAEFRQIKGHFERTLQVACCERDPEFRGMAKDFTFIAVVVISAGVQALLVEFGGSFVGCTGLTPLHWLYTLLIATITIFTCHTA